MHLAGNNLVKRSDGLYVTSQQYLVTGHWECVMTYEGC